MKRAITSVLIIILLCLNLSMISMASINNEDDPAHESEDTDDALIACRNVMVEAGETKVSLDQPVFEKPTQLTSDGLGMKDLGPYQPDGILNGGSLPPEQLQEIGENMRKSNLGYLFDPEDPKDLKDQKDTSGQVFPIGNTNTFSTLGSSGLNEKNVKVNNDFGMDSQYQPSIAIGPTSNNIYIVWLDNRMINVTFVYFARSMDNGTTFEYYNILNEKGTPGQPMIAVDINDYVYVVWHDDRDFDNDIWFTKSIDGGESWDPNLCVNGFSKLYNQTNPTIAIDNTNSPPLIWIAWQDPIGFFGSHDGIYITHSSDGGNTFVSPKGVYTNSLVRNATNPDIAVDDIGYIWLAWNEPKINITDENIYFTQSKNIPTPGINPPFKTPERVDDAPDGTNQTHPVIATYNHTKAYIAWQDARSQLSDDIYFAKYDLASDNFTSSYRINNDPGNLTDQIRPSIALNYTSGDIYLTWLDGRSGYYETYFASSTDEGNNFGSEVLIDDDFSNLKIDKTLYLPLQKGIAVDAYGDLHVVYSEDRYGNHDIFYQRSTDQGTTWFDSIIVNENNTASRQSNENPCHIAIGLDEAIHVVWEDSCAKNMTIGSDIYYAKSLDNGLTFTPGVIVNYNRVNWQTNPSIAINDTVILVSWTESPIEYGPGDIYFSYSTDGGLTFEYNQSTYLNMKVNDFSTMDNDHSVITCNSTGGVYIAYHGMDTAPPMSIDILVARSSYNPTISEFDDFTLTKINNDTSPFAITHINPTIAIDQSNDYVYVVWEDYRNQSRPGVSSIFFARSIDNGTSYPGNIWIDDDFNDLDVNTTTHNNPAIALNSNGNVSVVWSDNRTGSYNIHFTQSSDQGISFDQNKQINTNIVNDKIRPTIGISLNPDLSSKGNMYLTWQDSRDGDWDIYMAKSMDEGNTFSAEVKVSDDTGNFDQTFPSTAVNETGWVYVTWTDLRGYHSDVFNKPDIYIARLNNVSSSFNKSYCIHTFQGEPAIAVDENGTIYAVWTDYRFGHWDIFFARSFVGGQYFESNVVVNENNDNMRSDPDIAVKNGVIYVVWEDGEFGDDNKTIKFSRSINGGLTFENEIDIVQEEGNQLNPALAVDKTGIVHVVWQNRITAGYEEITYSNSTNWNMKKQVFSPSLPANQLNPCIALDDSQSVVKIYIAFENRTEDTDWNVTYIRSIDGGATFISTITLYTETGKSNQSSPSIDADSKGKVVVVWQDQRSNNWDIYCSISTDSGATFGSQNIVVKVSSMDELMPDVAIDRSNGSNIGIIFLSNNNTTPVPNNNVYFTLLTNLGTGPKTEVRVDDTENQVEDQLDPKLGTDSGGSFYGLWHDLRHGNADIYFNMTDRTLPHADAGPNIYLLQGYFANFISNGSWDNVGIANYSWTFNYQGTKTIYGYNAQFQFNLPGNFLVTLKVTDHSGNFDIDTLIVYVADQLPPSLFDDRTDALAYTGNSFTFRINATDTGLNFVNVAYWYSQTNLTTWNSSMSPGVGDQYTLSINIIDTLESIYYYFSANDTLNNWGNSIIRNKPVLDDDLPIFGLDSTQATAYTGNQFTFAVACLDNIEVDSGFVEFKYGATGTQYNFSMNRSGATFTVNIQHIEHTLNTLYYIFNFNDTSDNWNNTIQATATIVDDDKPTFVMDHSHTSAYTNETFNFSLIFDDNIAEQSAEVEYRYGITGSWSQLSLTQDGDHFNGSITIQNSLEDLYYFFNFTDTSSLWNTSTITNVDVIDLTPPMVISGSGDFSTTTGELFEIYIKVRDDVELGQVKLYYSKETTTTWENYVASPNINGKYSITNEDLEINTTKDTTRLRYYFEAKDTSNNLVSYGTKNKPFNVTVIDNDKPVADAGEDIDAGLNDIVLFDGTGSYDNIAIDKYTWSFEFDDLPRTLLGSSPDFEFTISGIYTVTLQVIDLAGNWDTDSVKVVIGGIEQPNVFLDSPDNNAGISDTYVTLTWHTDYSTPDQISYDIYFGTDEVPTNKHNTNPLEETEYTIEDLSVGSTYYWQVQPLKGSIEGDISPIWSFTIVENVTYGLEITTDTSSIVIPAGDSKSVTFTVKNTGSSQDTFELTVNKNELPSDAAVELDTEELTISALVSSSVKLTITTTDATKIDEYIINITGRSKNAEEITKDSIEFNVIIIEEGSDEDKDGLPDDWELTYFESIEQYDGDDDPDNDGKSNLEEYLNGTNPMIDETDSDNDNLPDAWELDYFESIEQYDGDDDPDKDELTNLQEYKGGTNPLVPDISDGYINDQSDDNSMLIAGSIAAVVIVIVVLLLLFMMLKKKKGGKAAGEGDESKTEEPEKVPGLLTRPQIPATGTTSPGPVTGPSSGQQPSTPTPGTPGSGAAPPQTQAKPQVQQTQQLGKPQVQQTQSTEPKPPHL